MTSARLSARTAVLLRGGVVRLPKALKLVGLLLAVGALIEFLPIDLAVVAVLVASMHASMAAAMLWRRVRDWLIR